ncbi:MAG: hypothetical protein B6I26_00635 [Desulfobacteraceae bacterium 4572_130]|nr:MAG: hypothetical protein B6I26_00635 [Desulfobacteraceae bacterium 4572_130]
MIIDSFPHKFFFTFLYKITRFILAIMFFYASYDKILYPTAFAKIVYSYQILPDFFVNITAIVLPWLEFVLGVFLIAGFYIQGSAIITNILLIIFMGAIIFNLSRGLNINCGCFSTSLNTSISLLTILRDMFFIFLSFYLIYSVFFLLPRSKK